MLESWFGDKSGNDTTAARTPQAQALVDEETRKLALYHYDTCWFCGRVRGAIDGLNLTIELRNIHADRTHRETLMREGGSGTVPCLRIEHDDGGVEWLYESADIIACLERRFS
ncbi:MAG: glutathione S-transferase N-terminal domain-containing protein [Gammaproteobacteria bacterium]|jgi:glutathione S-transferase